MKKVRLTVFILTMCGMFLTSCSKDNLNEDVTAYNQVVTSKAEYTYNQTEVEVLEDINIYRRALGLSDLEPMAHLSVESEDHNFYMIETGKVSHDNFSQRASYLMNELDALAVSENVAYGYRTADAVVDAWLKSQGHRENIEGDYTHFGISIRKDEDGKNYFTNIFIRK